MDTTSDSNECCISPPDTSVPAHLRQMRGIVVLGPPGVGKTSAVKQYQREQHEAFLWLAPSHALKIRLKESGLKNVNTLQSAACGRGYFSQRTVVITEGGMMTAAQFTNIRKRMQVRNSTIIIDLDPWQNGPVLSGNDKPFFKSVAFKEMVRRKKIEVVKLHVQRRTRNMRVVRVIDAVQSELVAVILQSMLLLILESLVKSKDVPVHCDVERIAATHRVINHHWKRHCARVGLVMDQRTNLVLDTMVQIRTNKRSALGGYHYTNGEEARLLSISEKSVTVSIAGEVNEDGLETDGDTESTTHVIPNMIDGTPAVQPTFMSTSWKYQGHTAENPVYVYLDTPSAISVNFSALYVMATRSKSRTENGPPENLFFVLDGSVQRFVNEMERVAAIGPFTKDQVELSRVLKTL